ncbi:MAG: Piwi domain-containing protein [bacterium]
MLNNKGKINKTHSFIRINFYSMSVQEFEFKIWRKPYRGESKEGSFQNFCRNSLPKQINLDERSDYWISFESEEDFEEFVCKQNYNHRLTQHFLFHLLLKKVKVNLRENEYITPRNKFRKILYFVLNEHTQGQEVVWLEPYFLHPIDKFGFLIDFKFRKNPGIPFSRTIQRLSLSLDSNYRSNRNFYGDKYQKVQSFLNNNSQKIFPLSSNDIQFQITKTPHDLPIDNLETKKYVFKNNNTDVSQYKGLDKNGPLENIQKNIVLQFIYLNTDKYLADDLKKALIGDLYGIAFKGLESLFKIKIKEIKDTMISDYSKRNLEYSIKETLALKQTENNALVIPILVTYKEDSETYYFMKYQLLKESLPLQVVTSQLLRKKENLKWSISNIALQIFAKIGGKPWQVLPSHEKGIIFGIGQAHQKSDDKIIKYFAYSVCTDSSGLYKKISILGKSDDEKSYLEQLKDNIVKTVEQYLNERYTTYVLHVPFKIRKYEINVIYKAIEEFANQKEINNINFVVLRINTKNKFFGYAYTNSMVPYESTYTLLSNTPPSYLVWFEGLQYHRETIYKRIAGPVYIEFYWSNKELSKEEEKKYLQDILNLSGANWRGFNAKSLPISVYYCQLIASFIKKFPEEIENIESVINPWFL